MHRAYFTLALHTERLSEKNTDNIFPVALQAELLSHQNIESIFALQKFQVENKRFPLSMKSQHNKGSKDRMSFHSE